MAYTEKEDFTVSYYTDYIEDDHMITCDFEMAPRSYTDESGVTYDLFVGDRNYYSYFPIFSSALTDDDSE